MAGNGQLTGWRGTVQAHSSQAARHHVRVMMRRAKGSSPRSNLITDRGNDIVPAVALARRPATPHFINRGFPRSTVVAEMQINGIALVWRPFSV